MVYRRQASGAVDFVTDVVTRTFSLLVKVMLVLLLMWAVPTYAPSIAAFFNERTEPQHIDFTYSSAIPKPQVTVSASVSERPSPNTPETPSVSPRPSE